MNDIQNRESRMKSFMAAIADEKRLIEDEMMYQTNDTYKERKLNTEIQKCKHDVVNEFFGKLYIDSLPLDDDYKDSHKEELKASMGNFIDKNGGIDFISERLKETSSIALKTILETADKIASDYQDKCREKFNTLTVDGLNYRMSDEDESYIDKISKDLELDEVSTIIQDHVKETLNDEIERSKFEEEEQRKLQEELAIDEDITTESALNEAVMDRLNRAGTFYQPSLFESIMVCESGKSDDMDVALGNTIAEYTIHAVAKAMKLKNYDKDTTINLSNQYRA